MPRFFISRPISNSFEITGEDANHIIKSLRMKINETLTLCHDFVDYNCKIIGFEKNCVKVKLLNVQKCESEPQVKVTLFQGIPKSDKMDLIVQKAVEIGVSAVVPVFTNRCVSRPDERSLNKKVQRWQKISLEAAKQSGRGCVPKILNVMNLDDAINFAKHDDKMIIFYEGGGKRLSQLVNNEFNSVSIFIGPEGGFENYEVDLLSNAGGLICSLGKRIFRTETAAIVSTALTIYESELTR